MSTVPTQLPPGVAQDFAVRHEQLDTEDYNYRHFRTRHLLSDAQKTLTKAGIGPGALAPDFELACVGGGSVHLSDLRGKPTLLHFGSFT